MKRQTNQMMFPGVLPKELAISHMRKPGKRVPVAGVSGAERPEHVIKAEAGADMGVLRHVNFVININKPVVAHRQEHEACGKSQGDVEGFRPRKKFSPPTGGGDDSRLAKRRGANGRLR